jgi:hypothetical protein
MENGIIFAFINRVFLISKQRGLAMIAYEFYIRDPKKGDRLIGILPERRKDSSRITEKSIMHWVENILGRSINGEEVYYIKVRIDEDSGDILKLDQSSFNQN